MHACMPLSQAASSALSEPPLCSFSLYRQLAIWKTLLQASLVLPPQRNPFKAATVVRESNDLEICEWSCSSCFVYALCGREEGAPALPALSDKNGIEELKKKLRKMGKALAQSQQPSAVP